MDENKKEGASLYKLQNCMWTELASNPFSFHCLLRNYFSNEPQYAISYCNQCANFKDSNVEIDGGYLG